MSDLILSLNSKSIGNSKVSYSQFQELVFAKFIKKLAQN